MFKSIITIILTCCLVVGCFDQGKSDNELWFSVTSDYPPFEYISNNELVGFDVELAQLIAKELGMEAKFKDMQFSAILVAVQNEMVDASISTLTITPDREKNFDFSKPYYHESLAMVTKEGQAIPMDALAGKTIACQLGSTMESWLQSHASETKIVALDTNPQAIEALKADLVDGVLIDEVQAVSFVKQNLSLQFEPMAKADTGYGIAFKKGSPLVDKVNAAIAKLEAKGELDKLKKKYLEVQ